MFWLVALGSVILISFLVLLCTKRKKRASSSVTVVSYGPKLSHDASAVAADEDNPVSAESIHSNHQNSLKRVSSEGRRSHSLSVASQRGLPDLPQENNEPKSNSIKRNSSRTGTCSGSIDENSHNDMDSRHSSPKGRKLPNPPPNDEIIAVNHFELHQQQAIQDEEDMYAKVGDNDGKPSKPEIKTLHIKEGSGDSSFYAKVGGEEEGDVDLYAQVEDQKIKLNGNVSEQSSSNDATTLDNQIQYGDAEYASIDKIKKTSVKRKPSEISESSQVEPPAPPIPERNFDIEDEENNNEAQNTDTQQDNEEEPQKGPMYDKLCVRESLDHIKKRVEVEQERKVRYANVSAINENSNGVYAQIDDPNSEGLYESLSVPGSADGTFIPPQQNNLMDNTAEYTSITEINNVQPALSDTDSTGIQELNNQRAPPRLHHYEQIEQQNDT